MAPELTKTFRLLLQLPQFTVLGSTCLARDSVLHRRFLALVGAEECTNSECTNQASAG
jgi:hypothetical protein